QLCLSEKLECFPTENSDGTFYSVPPYEDLDCIYTWTNVTDHVLANNDGKADKDVIASNCTSLHTFKCYKTIKYFRDCTFEEGEKTATCETKCFQSAGIRNPHHRGSSNGTGTSRYHMPVPLIILCVLLLVIL
ncbi:hypothetical protein AMECASPLE_034004, partial [Ameca splendens]